MILFIGGPVDWGVGGGGAWETWMGDIGYRGRGCVTLLSLESEKGKEKEVMTDAQTDGQMDRISTCRLDPNLAQGVE